MLLSLTACGKPLAVSDGAVLNTAPVELLAPTTEPELTGPRVNSAVVDYINALKDALRAANDGKAAFLYWWKENTK